ncbi:MAG: glycosyltransferase [Thermoanaerobaculales bacterium]|nr:glycosyltransferase [Thermoanaerobaculales bacterium]
MSVAAIVVRWRGGAEIERCLGSLLGQRGGHLGRVVLVDSGSGDGGAERLAKAFPEVEVLALSENRSFAHAANAGAATVDDELLLLLNPDTAAADDAVATLVGELEARPRAAGAVPILYGPDGASQHRWQLRRLPTVARLALGLPGAPAFAEAPRRPAVVAQPAAAAWLVRRRVWLELGGLDEAFAPAWWEDVDLCARLAARLGEPGLGADEGFVVAPAARVEHQGGSSVGELAPAAFLTAYHGNLVRYAARHHPRRLDLVRRSVGLSLLVRAAIRPGRASAYLAALRSSLRRSEA